MDDIFLRLTRDLFDRIDGPMEIRLIIQPIMGTIFATRDGLKDAARNDPPYGLSLFLEPQHRGHRLRDGWRSIRKVFFAALVVDVVYQLIELRWIYLGEALIIAQIEKTMSRIPICAMISQKPRGVPTVRRAPRPFIRPLISSTL